MYAVEWLEEALSELTTAWTNADSVVRNAITQAVHHAEQQLAADPFANSESRESGRRVTIVSPLSITFRVEENEQTVTIVNVWAFRTRS